MTGALIKTIHGPLRPDDRQLRTARQSLAVIGQQRLFYPYQRCLLRHRAKSWLGATSMELCCLIDCRTRVAATADPFRTETVETGDAWVLDRRVDEDAAVRLAERYVSHALRQRHKALALHGLEIVESEAVYKPFWTIDCQPPSGNPQTLLFDGVTGEICALAAP